MRKLIFILFVILFSESQSYSQNSQKKLSKLGDPVYFENHVKYISDADLFNALNLDIPGLEKVKLYSEKKEYQKAYEEWGNYHAIKNKITHIIDEEEQYTGIEEFKNNIDMIKKKEILYESDRIMKNEINGWGSLTLKFDSIIDFNANYGESGKYGFHYFIWSKPLYMAALLTEDEKYTKKFDEIFSQWYDQRYRVTGIYDEWDVIYYELGIGIRNRFFMINYFFNNPDRKWRFHEKMLKTILGSGNWCYQMESTQPYTYENRQLVAIVCLGMMGLYFPEIKDSKIWVDLAYEKTMEHLEKDFYSDGANYERSPWGYTSLTYNSIRNFYYQLRLNGYSTGKLEIMKQKLSRTVDWWIKVLAPNTDLPSTNDGNRKKFPAKILIDAVNLYGMKDNMGILHTLFSKPEFKSYPLPKGISINLPVSGYALMRSGWKKDDKYMSINYGQYSGGHSHYCILDFDVYAFGKPLALDAGIGRTYDDTLHFKWYKASIAHNMIMVNDSNINKKEAACENPLWVSAKDFDYFSGSEKMGYKRFEVGYKRHFLYLKPDMWLVYDKINNYKENNVISWNLHLRGELDFNGTYFKSFKDSGLIIYPAENYDYEIKKGMAQIKLEKLPDDFEEIPWLRFKKQALGEMDFCSMIHPYESKSKIAGFRKIDDGCFELSTSGIIYEIYFKPSVKFGLDSDAELIIIERSGTMKKIHVISGTKLFYRGIDMLKSKNTKNLQIERY